MKSIYLGAYGGYGKINGAYKSDGDFAQGRLALGMHLKQWQQWMLGGEVGQQYAIQFPSHNY